MLSGSTGLLGQLAGQKIQNGIANFPIVGFQSEVSSVVEMHFRAWDVPLERLCAWRQKERIVLAPDSQHRRLLYPEIFLELGIERHVTCVVEKQVQLDFVITRPSQKRGIQLVSLWGYHGFILDAMDVLPLGRFRLQKIAQGRAVRLARLLPVSLDRVPTFAQTLLIRIAVLRDDSRDTLRVSQGEPEPHGRSVIEHINRVALEANRLNKAVDDLR